MKNFKIFIALALVAAFSALIVSCQKENLNEPLPTAPSAAFTKIVTLSDASGKNTATLKLTASDPGYLAFCEQNLALTEVVSVEERGGSEGVIENTDPSEIETPYHVEVEEISRNLEPGALGFRLKIEAPQSGERGSYYFGTWTFTSNYAPHYFYVKNTSSGVNVKAWFHRKSGNTWYCNEGCWGCNGITLGYNQWASCSSSASTARRMKTQGTGSYSYYVDFY